MKQQAIKGIVDEMEGQCQNLIIKGSPPILHLDRFYNDLVVL